MLIPGGISEFIGPDGIRGLEDAAYVNPRYDPVAKDAGTLKKMVCRSFAVSEMKERLKSLIDETDRLFDVHDGDGIPCSWGRSTPNRSGVIIEG